MAALRPDAPAAPHFAGNGLAHLLRERRRMRLAGPPRPGRKPIPLDSIRARGRALAARAS